MGLSPATIVGIASGIIVLIGATGAVIGFIFSSKKAKITLTDPNVKITLRLLDKEEITHDTRRFKFALPTPEHILGLPVCNHIFFSARVNGELVVRPYTPVSLHNAKGYVDFVIKVYKAGSNDRFPQGGKLSQYLEKMVIGSTIEVRGPAGHITYKGEGLFHIQNDKKTEPTVVKGTKLSLIAGGTGITPMMQIANYILREEKNKDIKIRLLFANNNDNDILLRDDIENLADEFGSNFQYWYTLVNAPRGWRYDTGFVDEAMLQEHIFPPGEDTLALLCGPAPMINLACKPNLVKIRYTPERILTF